MSGCTTYSDPAPLPSETAAWTNACIGGEIKTGASFSGEDVTTLNFFNNTIDWTINDGDTFIIDDGLNPVTFEIDLGPQVEMQLWDVTGNTHQIIQDGYFFVLDNPSHIDPITGNAADEIFQFNTGPVLEIAADTTPTSIAGQLVQIKDKPTDPAQTSTVVTFEFLGVGGTATAGTTTVQLQPADTAEQIANRFVTAVNGVGALDVVANQVANQVTFARTEYVVVVGDTDTMRIKGSNGTAQILEILDVDRIVDGDQIEVRIKNGVNFVQSEVFTFGRDPSFDIEIESTDDETAIAHKLADQIETRDNLSSVRQLPDGALLAVVQSETLLTDWTAVPTSVTAHEIDIVITTSRADAIDDPVVDGLIDVLGAGTNEEVGVATETFFNTTDIGPGYDGIDVGFAGIVNPITGTREGGRLNFVGERDCTAQPDGTIFCAIEVPVGPRKGDFRGIRGVFDNNVPPDEVWKDQYTAGGVFADNVRIGMMADDDTDQALQRMAATINNFFNPNGVDPIPPGVVSASASGGSLDLDGGTVHSPPDWMDVEGTGPGGLIKGLAILPDEPPSEQIVLFGVSDRGGFYRIRPNLRDPILGVVTENIPAPDLLGIRFAGLTIGPPNVEDGRFRNMFFGVDEDGRLYAFDVEGNLQPIFNETQNSVQLREFETNVNHLHDEPLTDITGLVFGNLDKNLFHIAVTDTFSGDHLADENSLANQLAFAEDGHNPLLPYVPARGTYDFAGGAHGTVISNEFSLVGYSGYDSPVLYLTYSLVAGAEDPARVFISDNGAEWLLLDTDRAEWPNSMTPTGWAAPA